MRKGKISAADKEEVRPFYEEGGRAIGRQIMYNPDAEKQIWKLVSGLRLWKRWYLQAFVRLYAEENPTEYERIRKRRYRKGKRIESKKREMADLQREAHQRLKGDRMKG